MNFGKGVLGLIVILSFLLSLSAARRPLQDRTTGIFRSAHADDAGGAVGRIPEKSPRVAGPRGLFRHDRIAVRAHLSGERLYASFATC